MTTYIEFHALQTVPPSCINRDDTGSPKSAVFGGVKRHRVSSQAWKRAIRNEFKDDLDLTELGVRTLEVPSKIAEKIRENHPEISSPEASELAQKALAKADFKLVEKKAKEGEGPKDPKTSYLFFLSRKEIEDLADIAYRLGQGEKISKKDARNALQGAQAFDVGLFGRMLADAPEANVDAACQVLHSISTHKVADEFDYFTAVDDLAQEDNAGAGMIGTVEFVSSTLYRYASINVDQLVSNIGDREAAARCVEAFAKAFALSMPTGKQNTFANRTRPDFLLVDVRTDQPYSLVNAFESPVTAEGQFMSSSISQLAMHLDETSTEYDAPADEARVMVADRLVEGDASERLKKYAKKASFKELVSFAADACCNAEGAN